MATVLMGWELGAGLGHVQPLLGVAKSLANRGHQPVFAVKNLLEAAPLLGSETFPVLQAPQWPPRPAGATPFRAASYADILAIRGFGDADELLPVVRAWKALLDLVRPALIVCDHSPTLCLAAYRSVPVVMIGTGFTVPPAEQRRKGDKSNKNCSRSLEYWTYPLFCLLARQSASACGM